MGLRIGLFEGIGWASGLVLDVDMCDAGFGTVLVLCAEICTLPLHSAHARLTVHSFFTWPT